MRIPRITVQCLMIAVAILCIGLRIAPDILHTMISNARGHAPRWIVPFVRERVRLLTPGMTAPRVWEELGLYRRALDAVSPGCACGEPRAEMSHPFRVTLVQLMPVAQRESGSRSDSSGGCL
jgi:hypothetical protein